MKLVGVDPSLFTFPTISTMKPPLVDSGFGLMGVPIKFAISDCCAPWNAISAGMRQNCCCGVEVIGQFTGIAFPPPVVDGFDGIPRYRWVYEASMSSEIL